MDHAAHGLVERKIAAAIERGDFDDLPGLFRPLSGLTGADDPDWWAKAFLKRERLRDVEIDRALEAQRRLSSALTIESRDAFERELAGINSIIAEVNTELGDDRIPLVDEKEAIAIWQSMRRWIR